ncbi:hypothetical protein pb186bvf_018161 [Paramecium bursaria]
MMVIQYLQTILIYQNNYDQKGLQQILLIILQIYICNLLYTI